MKTNSDRTKELREESGRVAFTDPLTSFLYQLMRDEVPCGTIETIVKDVISEGNVEIIFTNGYLAKYANNLAELIRNAGQIKLKSALEEIFTVEEKQVDNYKQVIDESADNVIPSEEIDNCALSQLEENIKDTDTPLDSQEIKMVTIDEAKGMVSKLQEMGGISANELERINNELDEVREEIEEIQKEEAEDVDDQDIEIIIDDFPNEIISMDDIDKILGNIIKEKK